MVTFQDAIALARRTYVAIAMLPDTRRKQLEAELREAYAGPEDDFEDWLPRMASQGAGPLRDDAIELLALYDLDEVKDEAERFLTNAGERVPSNQEQA